MLSLYGWVSDTTPKAAETLTEAMIGGRTGRCKGADCHRPLRFVLTSGSGPTSVMGEAGESGPVIAFLGEYDALPGLSQEARIAEHKPIEAGGHGHGCGHNLLGSGAMLAAVGLKNFLAEKRIAGRVRYYGCPGEEGGAAKAFMVREEMFDDVDIAISWHPFHTWQVVAQGKSPAAHKAMVHAAKAMAATGLATLIDPMLIEDAKAALAQHTAQSPYVSPLRPDAMPPLGMSTG